MPNHVHVIVQPLASHELTGILHTWKSYTAARINRVLHRKGPFWERESFSHLIRNGEDIERFAAYIEHNPVAAGLIANPKERPFSCCGAGFQPAGFEFIEPRRQPFAEPRTRGELTHLYKECGVYFVTWRLLDAVILNGSGSRHRS
ncbi:MAG: transposase [Armatimonadota bacterium]